MYWGRGTKTRLFAIIRWRKLCSGRGGHHYLNMAHYWFPNKLVNQECTGLSSPSDNILHVKSLHLLWLVVRTTVLPTINWESVLSAANNTHHSARFPGHWFLSTCWPNLCGEWNARWIGVTCGSLCHSSRSHRASRISVCWPSCPVKGATPGSGGIGVSPCPMAVWISAGYISLSP